MANPHKGEVTFEADGKSYTLRYSANAICELEDALGMGMVALAREMQSWAQDNDRIRLSMVRTVFWAGLRDHHPDIDRIAAGEVVAAIGGVGAALDLIGQAFLRALPGDGGARPPMPGVTGTGQDSSRPGSSSVSTRKASGKTRRAS